MVNAKQIPQPNLLQFNLLDNALDSLLSAAEAARRDEGPRSLKEAVLHLANGVELLIKSRLVREHWSLIFSNTDKASYEELAKADFKSVDFSTACSRLEKIAGLPIRKSAVSQINGLRKLRNQLTHFAITLDSVQAKSLIAKTMTFCVDFCEEQSMNTGTAKEKLSEIHMNLTEFTEFVGERMKSISTELDGMLVWECPECWQETLAIDGGNAECKFCGRKHDPPRTSRQ